MGIRISKSGVMILAVAVLFLWLTNAEAKGTVFQPRNAKHIILFIGDGMQLEHEIATSRYLYGKDTALSFHKLFYRNNVTTWDVDTYNKYADSHGLLVYDPADIIPVAGYNPEEGGYRPWPLQISGVNDAYFIPTDGSSPFAADSASTATAMATGFKTDSGNIAWMSGDPEDGELTTIAELLKKEKGYSIGVVSTVPFSHATPAAHVSHNTSRNNYQEIAAEIVETFQPDVVIGGGNPSYYKGGENYRYISKTVYDSLRSNGAGGTYAFAERQDGVDGTVSILETAQEAIDEGKKLFGLYGGFDGSFESPVAHDLPGTPCISRATMENPLLKDAALAALKVLSQDPDGFFIMLEQGDIDWSNHASDFNRMIGTTWDLHMAVRAVIDFIEQPGDDIDWFNTLLIVTSDHSNSYMRRNRDMMAGDLPLQEGEPYDFFYPDGEVSYSTSSHTNELVRLYAQGAGAVFKFMRFERRWYPCSRLIDNTHIYHVMASAAGVPQPIYLQLTDRRPARCFGHGKEG